jgi:HAE1 family hydrophobic/amphiphilic exporter-1
MIPIALGQGPGAAARASLAKVILGGQTLSLLLTLLVTPVAYSLWDDVSRVWWRLVGWVMRKPHVAPAAQPAPALVPAGQTSHGQP